MGWTTSTQWQSKKDLIAYLTKDHFHCTPRASITSKCVTKTLRGNTLWAVWDITNIDHHTSDFKQHRYIACYLLRSYGLRGFGYKDMWEDEGPFYYDCPLKYLDMVPEVANESWREGVRHYHARKHVELFSGLIVGLRDCVIPALKLTNPDPRKGWWQGVARDGRTFRIARKHLSGETFETWPTTA